MASIADVWLKRKAFIWEISIVTNVTLIRLFYIIVVVNFILISNWLNEYYNIIKVNIFPVDKELDESILVLTKLWLTLL